jgi:UDP-glucose 4-epimerase
MINLVLGGCGFVGTNLVDKILAHGEGVISVDNLSNGVLKNSLTSHRNYTFLNLDISARAGFENLRESLKKLNEDVKIWHLAANSDISQGSQNLFVDYEDTLGTTISALALVDELNVKDFIFASSSAVYGERLGIPMSENMEIIYPASAYGIAKLASEMTIFNKLKNYPTKVRIYRFPNVIGLPMTHGVFSDFYKKLKKKPDILNVLGDGNQLKPFLHVGDLIDSILNLNNSKEKYEIFNIGPNDKGIEIHKIAELMVQEFSPKTKIKYGSSPFGWEGDIPKYSFDLTKAIKNGLNPDLSSEKSVRKLIEELHLNG